MEPRELSVGMVGTDGQTRYRVQELIGEGHALLGVLNTFFSEQRVAVYQESAVDLGGNESPAGWYIGSPSSGIRVWFTELAWHESDAVRAKPHSMAEREDFLLWTIYDAYQSMRLYERENKVELSAIRKTLETVIDRLSPEKRAELHSRSPAAMVYDETPPE